MSEQKPITDNANQVNEVNEVDELKALFGDSNLFDESQLITTSKSNVVKTNVQKLKDDVLVARNKAMKEHGVKCRFITSVRCGKNSKGGEIRKPLIKEGYFMFRIADADKEVPTRHLKAIELDPSLAGTCKHYVTPKIDVLNGKDEVTASIRVDGDNTTSTKGYTS